MLTTEQLNTIKERAEKAQSGPWEIDDIDRTIWNMSGRNYVGSLRKFPIADIEFIAHARTDIPALLQSIDELKKALLDTTEESDIFRENLKTIERLTECETTRDFATRALKGEATLRIGGGAND